MKRWQQVVIVSAFVAGSGALAVRAAGIPSTPNAVAYSGVLLDAGGNPVTSQTPVSIAVNLFAPPADPAPAGATTAVSITPDATGHFRMGLDECLQTLRDENEIFI